jgi:hypothetical protein
MRTRLPNPVQHPQSTTWLVAEEHRQQGGRPPTFMHRHPISPQATILPYCILEVRVRWSQASSPATIPRAYGGAPTILLSCDGNSFISSNLSRTSQPTQLYLRTMSCQPACLLSSIRRQSRCYQWLRIWDSYGAQSTGPNAETRAI